MCAGGSDRNSARLPGRVLFHSGRGDGCLFHERMAEAVGTRLARRLGCDRHSGKLDLRKSSSSSDVRQSPYSCPLRRIDCGRRRLHIRDRRVIAASGSIGGARCRGRVSSRDRPGSWAQYLFVGVLRHLRPNVFCVFRFVSPCWARIFTYEALNRLSPAVGGPRYVVENIARAVCDWT